jgi:hypothetical protein
MRILLEYADQNDRFAAVLPRAGTVERGVTSRDGSKWVVFRLDLPVGFEGQVYHRFLLKSRWIGYEITDPRPTSVFILLVGDSQDVREGFEVGQFEHIAWGMVNQLGQ